MVLFVPPETCEELGLAPAPALAPASPHVATHQLPFLGDKLEGEGAAYPADPETAQHELVFTAFSFLFQKRPRLIYCFI